MDPLGPTRRSVDLLSVLFIVVLLPALQGCALVGWRSDDAPAEQVDQARDPVPPPWAPAPGARRRQRVEMVFDERLALYLIMDHPGHYFDGTRYYRTLGERWQVSRHLDGPWAFVPRDDLPPGLAKKAEERRRGDGPLPAKHGY